MVILREHLRKSDYDWEIGLNHSLQNNEPDRRIFNRFNGNQVLFMINYFGTSVGKMTFTEGLQIEELISTQLPKEAKSELSVFNWLRGVYLYFNN
ncbi:hypothetical protein A4D02_27070 [Niastella koreensis]|uniref:Uncharacterized protein n=2 Tax=Niastella koreensis TaxID=354356 RepID=G8TFR7_NIAKG|nr:hypothetical protein [Niastella koreensis]AEV99506.1 hypothetical protein Niako_3176 [Niastella koreensis GR20-10]OQP50098.1 hypothetical protein A4D02_27070 [Niastella koreensis]